MSGKKLHFVLLFATAFTARKLDTSGGSRPVAAGDLNLKFGFLLLPIQLAKGESNVCSVTKPSSEKWPGSSQATAIFQNLSSLMHIFNYHDGQLS